METLAEQALAALPSASPWRKMWTKKFVGTVSAFAADLPDAITRFLADFASPPRNPSEDAATEAKMPFMVPMTHIFTMLDGIMDMDTEGDSLPFLLRVKGLKDFFPGAQVPAEPVPTEFQAKLMLAVFRDLFPSVRRLVLAFSDPQRRKAWKAWSPREARPNDSLQGAQLRDTQIFDYYYYEPYDLAGNVIRLFTAARPLRRRLSEDVALLDALALGILGSPLVRRACFTKPDLLSWEISDLKSLEHQSEDAFDPLRIALVEHAKLYREHLEAGRAASDNPPALVLINCLATRVNTYESYLMGWHPGPNTSHRKVMVAALASIFQSDIFLRRALGLPYAGGDDQIAQFQRGRQKTKEKYGNILDSCDQCDKPFQQDESLKRCSRCLTARYCSQNCQVEAWKKGRKVKDETGKMVIVQEAHKLLCLDAKPAPWKAKSMPQPKTQAKPQPQFNVPSKWADSVKVYTPEEYKKKMDAGDFDDLKFVRAYDATEPGVERELGSEVLKAFAEASLADDID